MKKELFSGTFFLIISILLTAAAAAEIMSGTPGVFTILLSISSWLTYASAKEDGPIKGARLGAGTVKAMYIVGWVVVGIIAVSALVVMFFPSLIYNGIYNYGNFYFHILPSGSDMSDIFNFFSYAGTTAFVWMGLAMLLAAAAMAVINLLYVRSLLSFARSVRDSAQADVWQVEKALTVSRWMFVLGIIAGTGILGIGKDSISAFAAGCAGSAMIVASKWIKLRIVPTCAEPGCDQPTSEWYSPEN